VVEAVLLVGGFLVGLMVGRWWALIAALAVGAWIAAVSEVEVPSLYLGVVYAVLSGLGIAAGISLRRTMRTDRGCKTMTRDIRVSKRGGGPRGCCVIVSMKEVGLSSGVGVAG
jgi:hypothetical protein